MSQLRLLQLRSRDTVTVGAGMLLCLAVLLTSNLALPASAADKPDGSPVADPWNDRLSIAVGGDGTFSVGALPDPSSGAPTTDSFKLLYGWPSTGTSYTTLRVDGNDARLGADAAVSTGPTDSGDANSTTWADGDIATTQSLTLVTNPQTGKVDAVRASYRVANGGTVSHDVGVRAMLDTDVNDNDGAPYRIPGIGAVTTEQDLTDSQIPDTFQVFQDLSDSNHIAAATLRGADATPPDRLVVAAWPQIVDNKWDYTPDPGRAITSDSAYAAYWNPQSLAPGASRTYVTYYGLASVTIDLTPPMALGLTGPASLTVSGSDYSPNPFSVVATVSDDGSAPITGAGVRLTLPPGMHTGDPVTVDLGTLNPGDPERLVTWHVSVDPQVATTTLSYSVTASASNTDSKTLSRTVAVPALANSARYLALGDSYSAGEGNPPYQEGSDDPVHLNSCHRSDAAYGPLLDADQGLGPMVFGACSGAYTDDFVVPNPLNPNEPPQLARVTASNRVITLTIGGNDAGFVEVLKACIQTPFQKDWPFIGPRRWGCSEDRAFVRQTNRRIEALYESNGALTPAPGNRTIHPLGELLSALHQRAPEARIVVGGYPTPFGSAASGYARLATAPSGRVCYVYGRRGQSIHASVDYRDALWMDQLAGRINAKLARAVADARQSGLSVRFVVPQAFDGHGLCDRSTSWIYPLLLDSSHDPLSGSFHPTAVGQRRGYLPAFRRGLR